MKALRLIAPNQLKYKVVKPIESDAKLIELKASALNHRDVWILRGKYPGIHYPVTLGSDGTGYLEGKPVLINPGMDWGAKESQQSGKFNILGLPNDGTFAEYVSVKDQYIYNTPAHLNLNQSAALPLGGVTAYRSLFTKCSVKPQDKVLISGIGGGVALFAFQFALAIGCQVIVTSSSYWKRKQAIDKGAVAAYDYNKHDWYQSLIKEWGGVDVVIDSAGGDGFSAFPAICHPGGRICFYGGTMGNINGLNPQTIFWKQLSIFGTTMGSSKDFGEMMSFVEKNKITPIIDEVIPLSQGPKGFEKMEEAKQFGKIVFINGK